ncbi:MAG: cytochrome P450, partial [Acidobacteriia bacterium]|nr:cytochrome P450 [Terriglobia bacterium]
VFFFFMLYPPAWSVARMNTELYRIGPFVLPPKTLFIMVQYLMNRDERWFPERGPEVATVYLHVAELAGAVDPDELREVYREASLTLRDLAGEAFPMPDAEMFPYLNPESLFEQACAMDPNPGAFQRWVDWAGERDDSAAVRAAEAWRRALPQDPRPLLCLMRHAEKRQALKKALSYLRDAELLDGVSSEVRRARLRLLVNGAFRHIQQGKWRLALPELDELEALPQAREGDRLVFIAALRYFACSRAGDAAGVAATLRNIEQSIGSIAAALLLSSAGSLCGGSYGVEAGKLSGGWIEALLRVRDIGLDMGYSIRFDAGFRPRILHELWSAPATDLDSLFKLAAIAVKQQWRDVAYVISTAGLTRPDPREGHFLLLRARALPDLELRRAEDCIRAAFTLARRNNDSALAQSAIELWREMRLEGPFNVDPGLMDNRKLDKLLQRERLRVKPPQYGAWDLHGGLELASSPRRKPRRSRRRPFESDAELPF